MDETRKASGLEAEIEGLRQELERFREREKDFEETRRAMLYLLEDLNESAAGLTKAKEEWEATFDSISDALFIHDNEMRIVRCNRAYQKAAGVPFKEIIGRPYYEVFPRMDGPLPICTACLSGECETADQDLPVPSIDKVFKVRGYAIKTSGGLNNFIHIMEDITEERKAEEREKALYRFSRKIGSRFELDYRLRVVCETAVEFGYLMAWVGLLDEKANEVVPMAQAGLDEGYLSSIKVRYDDSPLGNGPAGRAIRSKKPEIQNDIRGDAHFEPWRDEAVKRGYGSGASFPVLEQDNVIAVLTIYSGEERFPEKDVGFLQTFANNTAAYIKNAALFKEVKETSERVREEMAFTNQLLTLSYATAHTTDMDKLMEEVAGRVNNMLGSDICLSYLWDREKKAFYPCQGVGLSRGMSPVFKVEPLEAGSTLVKSVLEKNAPVILTSQGIKDAGTQRASSPQLSQLPIEDAGAFKWVKGLNEAAAIPLCGKEDFLGLIACLYTGENSRFSSDITERDRVVMDSISYQVSTALEEARLFKLSTDRTMELSRKIETIQTMHEIDRSILSTLEPQEILETATRMVGKAIACDRATVALVDRDRGGFTFAAGYGIISLAKGSFTPFTDTNAYEVVRTGRLQYAPNLSELKGAPPLEKAFLKEGFLSHIRVPLVIKGEVIGVLTAGSKRAAAFTSEDLSILEKLSSQISVALENSRLLTDLEELFMGAVKTLSGAIDAKSPWTGGHSERVTRLAIGIGLELGLKHGELKDLELAGLLHDLGKLGTYESILDKPGKLTEEESSLMKMHPGKGAEILSPIRQMERIIPAIKYHHECYGGGGYPEGLKGEEIPLMARILTVADTVDAMGADRPYRKGKPMEAIIAELKRCSGTQFDPVVVEAFLRSIRASKE